MLGANTLFIDTMQIVDKNWSIVAAGTKVTIGDTVQSNPETTNKAVVPALPVGTSLIAASSTKETLHNSVTFVQ